MYVLFLIHVCVYTVYIYTYIQYINGAFIRSCGLFKDAYTLFMPDNTAGHFPLISVLQQVFFSPCILTKAFSCQINKSKVGGGELSRCKSQTIKCFPQFGQWGVFTLKSTAFIKSKTTTALGSPLTEKPDRKQWQQNVCGAERDRPEGTS